MTYTCAERENVLSAGLSLVQHHAKCGDITTLLRTS